MFESSLHSLPLLHRGKVRDNYAVGHDRILMLASDRISAFDVVMEDVIPGKGALLTRMALFWFERLRDIAPNHLRGEAPTSVVSADEAALVEGRAMLVKRLQPLPIEAVVRGYLAGSGWKDYQHSGQVCGIKLPAGLRLAERLAEPIFTPASKAPQGMHDENIGFDAVVRLIGAPLAQQVRELSLALYRRARDYAATRGILIADTKFEFGLDADGQLTLMDEVLTPDSSRFWPTESYQLGSNPPSFDKQFLRDYLEALPHWNKQAPAPRLPAQVIEQTAERYRTALRLLTA